MRKEEKFTFIELLVVIAIIAIMAALLLPALNQACAKAKAIKCVGNLKQLYTAFYNYQADSHGYMPYCLDVYGNLLSWGYGYFMSDWSGTAGNVWDYYKNKSYFACPIYRPQYALLSDHSEAYFQQTPGGNQAAGVSGSDGVRAETGFSGAVAGNMQWTRLD